MKLELMEAVKLKDETTNVQERKLSHRDHKED